VRFRNEHDLLAYLVRLYDSENKWRLSSGQQLAFHLRDEGLLDPSRPDQEYAELGRMLWALKEDDAISFVDGASRQQPHRPRNPSFLSFTMDDVFKFEDIAVRLAGRNAVNAGRNNGPAAPRTLVTTAEALLADAVVTDAERSAMLRYLKLTDELRSCAYFVQEERSMTVTLDQGTTTSWDQTLPSAGATRDMLALLRQLFGDNERASFASMAALVRRSANPHTETGAFLLRQVDAFERAKQGVLDSWDAQPEGAEVSPRTPLETFLDWMYGEFLHSDEEKAARIQELDTEYRLYEWQFHWVVERLAMLFSQFAGIVRGVHAQLDPS